MAVEDSKMDDATTKETKEEEVKTDTTPPPPPPPMPPLEAAARRLERSLGGSLLDKERILHTYTNPAKVVRRWLGTASGTAGNATVADIAAAARVLLDPSGPSATGRELLVAGSDTSMEIETTTDAAASATSQELSSPGYLTAASSREAESWLLSLCVRILWKEKQFSEAFGLVQKAISILLGHLEAASLNITALSGVTTSSLFPLLARMYRYQSLLVEELKDIGMTTTLRLEMTKAHNLASLRRDVDCQATLLNLMLRDLLRHSESK